MSKIHINGVQKNSDQSFVDEVIKQVFLESTNNLKWLKKNDKVLLKPALNSPDPYPSTTHPRSVAVVADILKERGAKVYVGDQSGIEHVFHSKQGVVKGSSKKNYHDSGMGKGVDAKFVAFEDGDWIKDFYLYKTKKTVSWPNGFYLTKWIKEVDHIISLPRLSTHAMSGVTLGYKNMVGVLRQDSRTEFHAKGPFNSFISSDRKRSSLKKGQYLDFFNMMVEISLALQEKLRCTLFTATKAQTTFGPDKIVGNFFKSHVSIPEQGLVFASNNSLAAEVFALAHLIHLYKSVPTSVKQTQKLLMFINKYSKELGKESVWKNPFITHALKLGLGNREIELSFTSVSKDFQKTLADMVSP